MNLLKEENENKPFIIKSLLQDQNNLSNMGANFLLEHCKLQSFEFLRKISEEIPMDNCFSEGKRSTQVYSKERLNENPESKISSNNDIDFKMEPTIETITKENTMSIILQRLITIPIMTNVTLQIKIMLAIPIQATKKSIKIRIIIKIRRMENQRKNGSGNKKRKKHRWIKTPGTEKENQSYL